MLSVAAEDDGALLSECLLYRFVVHRCDHTSNCTIDKNIYGKSLTHL